MDRMTTVQKVASVVLFGTIGLAFLDVGVRPVVTRAYDYVRDRFADDERIRTRSREAILSQDVELLDRLVRSGKPTDRSQILCEAIGHGFVAGVETMLKSGVSPNVRCRAEPALHTAVGRDQLAVVKLLLTSGADVNALNPAGQSARYVASCNHPRRPAIDNVSARRAVSAYLRCAPRKPMVTLSTSHMVSASAHTAGIRVHPLTARIRGVGR